jgi:hypothetical protein
MLSSSIRFSEGVRMRTVLALAAVSIFFAGCAPSDAYYDYQDRQQDAYVDQYQYEYERDVEEYQREYYEEQLTERCIEDPAEDFYSEDDLIAYCEDNAYEYEYDYEPDYYSDDFYYEPDFDSLEPYDYGPRGW